MAHSRIRSLALRLQHTGMNTEVADLIQIKDKVGSRLGDYEYAGIREGGLRKGPAVARW
jgi:hypothetical protein